MGRRRNRGLGVFKKKAEGSVKKRLAAGFAVAVSLILLVTRMGLLSLDTPQDVPKAEELCGESISWQEVWDNREEHAGEVVAVTGSVESTAFVTNIEGNPTFINLGNPHPRTPRFEAVIWEDSRPLFLDSLPAPPEILYEHQNICVAGTVEIHEGVPQIEIRDPVQVMTVSD
ncbi:MAG: hypothetical protein R6V67_01535 [Spirochaetia bacterium]